MLYHRLRSALLLPFITLFLFACVTAVGEPEQPRLLAVQVQQEHAPSAPHDLLRVATLNIAHGRGDSLNQLLVSRSRITENLDTIAHFLDREKIDVVALQEADAESAWSGNFDHTRHLAASSGYRWWVQDSHARLGIANYGTALLSSSPITAAAALSFEPSPPTARKGFTVAEIQWQTASGEVHAIDVISVHMDFSRHSVREQQGREMNKVMQNRHNPMIIMGDFNSESLARRLVEQAASNQRHLHTWDGLGAQEATYKDKRLDWIILSGELAFVDHRAATDVLSDHRAVVATIRYRETTAQN